MTPSHSDRLDRIRAAAETQFGQRVQRIETPGGSARASCRVIFEDRSVIATHRPNFRRTHLEAVVLQHLSEACPVVPTFLGLQDNTLFQSDVGAHRLSTLIAGTDALGQEDLADQAVNAIFQYQIAAKGLIDDVPLPPLGVSDTWVAGLVNAVDLLAPLGAGVPRDLDRAALREALAAMPVQFVKWDCRSGNAAVDDTGVLRWFDFEYCGLRHGAEDIAWLIADEAWPVAPETMIEIVKDNHSELMGTDQEAYLEYLSLYVTFHALQRLTLIIDEVKRRGWRSKTKIRERDDVGRHPEFAANICAIGGYFADRSPLTRRLVPAFDAGEAQFVGMLRQEVA